MGFSNPITGGEDLIRSGIRSPNYVAGATGWRIAQDGSAEFNNVTIRGALSAGTITGDLVMAGGCILTAATGQRITICGAPTNQISFYTGVAAETGPGFLQIINSGPVAGYVNLSSPNFGSGQADLLLWGGPGYSDFQLDSTRGVLASGTRGLTWSSPGNGPAVTPLRFTGNSANIGRVGASVPHGPNFFEFANDFSSAVGDYALLQGIDGHTYLNASATRMIHLRSSNTDVMTVESLIIGCGMDGSDIQTRVIRYNQQGNWTKSGIINKSNVNESRIAFWADGQGSAPIFKNWFGDFECRDLNDTGFTVIRALAFNPSRSAYKQNIRRAEERLARHDRKRRIQNLETVHYQWREPEHHCACLGNPECVNCGGDSKRPPAAWQKGHESGWFGFLVDDVAVHFPEVVGWKEHEKGKPEAEAIELMGMIAVLWEEARDFEARIAALEGTKK